MTGIFYREYRDSFIIIAEGHAGFSQKGSDIVCAAVSVLAFTLLNCIKNAESDKLLVVRREIVRDGYFCVEAEPFDFARDKVETIFDTCFAGFSLLADEYPSYINIE